MRTFSIFNRNNSFSGLFFVIVCSSLMILDSIIVRIYANIPTEPPQILSLLLFGGLFVFLIFSNYILFRNARLYPLSPKRNSYGFPKLWYNLVVLNQILICGLIGSITLSILVFGGYNIIALSIIIYLSYFSAVLSLGFMTYRFFSWFMKRRNYLVLMYAFAFSILIMSLLVSIVYLSSELSYYDPVVKLRKIKTAISDSPAPPPNMSEVRILFDFSSGLAFLLIWIPTVIQLRTYSLRIGRAKYWIIVAIPIAFYFFPLIEEEIGVLDGLRFEYGRDFNLGYIILFSPYKQVGGLLFGLVFWITAQRIKRRDLKTMLQIAGTGMVLLFGSTVLHGLTYIVAPPFGIITIGFMGIASYMLMIGIFSSAREVANDTVIRRELYRSVDDHYGLIRNTSLAEMERIIEKNVRPLLDKVRDQQEEALSVEYEKEDLDEMIREVINEVHSFKRDQKNS